MLTQKQEHLLVTLAKSKPSVSAEDLKVYTEFTKMYGMEGASTIRVGEEDEADDRERMVVVEPISQRTRSKGKEKEREPRPGIGPTKRRKEGSTSSRQSVMAVWNKKRKKKRKEILEEVPTSHASPITLSAWPWIVDIYI